MDGEAQNRRADELEALRAYYGNDLVRSPLHRDRSSEEEEAIDTTPLEGPWFLRIRRADAEDGDDGGSSSRLGTPTLEIRLPSCYPLGETCPEPVLHNVMMKPQLRRQLFNELRGMYEAGMDVGIIWGERCREELLSGDMAGIDVAVSLDENHAAIERNNASGHPAEVRTFIPPTTRYSQPIRHFPIDVITNPGYRRKIIHTPPFHPPKSGPSEIMIAHTCLVECMEHVQWALADLLFNDKKVAKATHNMFAYRFTNRDGIIVSDNDDDGEKGSGSKLASLLDLCNAENVLVVVSRWFGGSLLGPARFKWIAGVARDGLVQGGFIDGK